MGLCCVLKWAGLILTLHCMSAWWVLVGFAVFLIGVTKSGFGAGVGLMIVPMTVIAMSHLQARAGAALGLMLPLLIVGDLIAVCQHRKLFNRDAVIRLLPGTLIGLIIGGGLLLAFDNQSPKKVTAFIEIEVGLESILLVSLHWWRTWRMGHEHVFSSASAPHRRGRRICRRQQHAGPRGGADHRAAPAAPTV